MTPKVQNHPWSEEALFSKALLFVQRMEAEEDEDASAIWSALALELLARAALARISPVLLADCDRDAWHQLEYALGRPTTSKKFSPRSIMTAQVFQRLERLVPDFGNVRDFCATHINRRNAELHSGELGFPPAAQWLPGFYKTCEVICGSIGRSLEELTNDPDAAREMIAALEDTEAQSVKKEISAHQTVWHSRSDAEKTPARSQAEVWATRHLGHRQECPACGNPGILQGRPRGPVNTIANEADHEITQKQKMLPRTFECVACGLKIIGYPKLQAAGLGSEYTATTKHVPADFFGLFTEEDIEEARAEWPEAEPDFNDDR
jgi:hypothetical protein